MSAVPLRLNRLDRRLKPVVSRASVVAAILGNVIEFYDFTVYAFFAVFIGRAFFPTGDAHASLLLAVATFGIGFVTRPLGAAIIGPFADRRGRRAGLLLTIVLMAVGMLLLAVTPGYATIGLAAPILVVVARLLQGFALGGEVGAASAYLIEAAAPDRRGLLGAWQIAAQGASTLIAGLVGITLSWLLPQGDLESWGWRVAILIGLSIVPVGLVMRRNLPETLEAAKASTTLPFGTLLREHPRPLLLGILAIMSATISIYTLNYMTTYAVTTLHLPVSVALAAPLVNGACTFAAALAGGWLSDRFGRKPLMIVPRLLLTLLAYPGFILVNADPSAFTLLLVTGLLTLLNAPSAAVSAVLIPESFPPGVRSTGFALCYAVAVTLFGGSAQVIVTWLIGATGDPLAPAGYLVVANMVGTIAMVLMAETHHRGAASHAVPPARPMRVGPGRDML
jgi:MFS family permease